MSGEHILIVDDERAIQTSFRGVLEDEGYRRGRGGVGVGGAAAISRTRRPT